MSASEALERAATAAETGDVLCDGELNGVAAHPVELNQLSTKSGTVFHNGGMRRRFLFVFALFLAVLATTLPSGSAHADDSDGTFDTPFIALPIPPQLQPVVDAVAPPLLAACNTTGTAYFLASVFSTLVPSAGTPVGIPTPVVGVIFVTCGNFPTPEKPTRCSIDDTLAVTLAQNLPGAAVPVPAFGGSLVASSRAAAKLLTGKGELPGADQVVVQYMNCREVGEVTYGRPTTTTTTTTVPTTDTTLGPGPTTTVVEGPSTTIPFVEGDVTERSPQRITRTYSVPGTPGRPATAGTPATPAARETAAAPVADAFRPIGFLVDDPRGSTLLLGLGLGAVAWRFGPRLLRRRTSR